MISRARNTRSYMPTIYQVGAAGSRGLGTTDLTRYQDRAAGSQGFGISDRTRLRGIRMGLQDLTGSDRQIQDAYKAVGPHG